MAIVRKPLPAKIFIGMLSSDQDLFPACEEMIKLRYGPIDLRSGIVPWTHTAYYQAEMGTGLLKKIIFLEQLRDPDILPSLKQEMVNLEKNWSIVQRGANCRRINIDPGYLTEAKVVLATTKDYAHRLYIGGNVYAEVELNYRKDVPGYVPLEHTYPDFRNSETIDLFNKAREILRGSLLSNGQLKKDRTIAP